MGKLVYNDEGKYEIHNSKGKIFYLSNVLDEMYYSNSLMSLRIMQTNKLFFNERGRLYMRRNAHSYYSYFVNGEDLESTLFDNVGEFIYVTLTSGAGDYGQFIEERAV